VSDERPRQETDFPAPFHAESMSAARWRAESARRPPASVWVPRLTESAPTVPGAAEYPLIAFGSEPWTTVDAPTHAQERTYAQWLNSIEAGRLAVILAVLDRAGAPVAGLREQPERLSGLGAWIQLWFPVLAAPLIGHGFIRDDPQYRLGRADAISNPQIEGYSRYGDALLRSLAQDLAFVVTDCARPVRPGVCWQAAFDSRSQHLLVTIDPDSPRFDLVSEVREFLVQSVARPRGAAGRQLREWYAGTLERCYQRAATGIVLPDARTVFPGALDGRIGQRYVLARPRPAEPAAPEQLTAMAAAFRQAGWFGACKLSTADLARAAASAWRAQEHEDIPMSAAEIGWRLLLLDGDRTWSEDTDAGTQPGDGIYPATVQAIGLIGGKELGTLWDPAEDWSSRPGDLLLSFRSRGGRHRLLIPAPGTYLSPALITGLNGLLPADGPRLWFLNRGQPVAIVTRATAGERALLEELTGVRLDGDPPGWWTALAPLPGLQDAEPGTGPPRTWPRRAAGKTSAMPPAPGLSHDPVAAPTSAPARNARATSHRTPASGTATAQDEFAAMMRDLIAPALRELGFKGTVSRWFWYRRGDYEGTFSTQKSRLSTSQEISFWVHLTAAHVPTDSVYWTTQLHALIPGNRDSSWQVTAGRPAGPVADRVLTAFRSYGWPAIQAALDSPGYPPDPAARWARTFPPAAHPATGYQPPMARELRQSGDLTGARLAELDSADPADRASAARYVGLAGLGDPRIVPALLDHLAHDPSPVVRRGAARSLWPLASQPAVRDALQAAAAQDEDLEVRWAARYAVRLVGLGTPPDPVGPSDSAT
jgi:hypothetical protein